MNSQTHWNHCSGKWRFSLRWWLTYDTWMPQAGGRRSLISMQLWKQPNKKLVFGILYIYFLVVMSPAAISLALPKCLHTLDGQSTSGDVYNTKIHIMWFKDLYIYMIGCWGYLWTCSHRIDCRLVFFGILCIQFMACWTWGVCVYAKRPRLKDGTRRAEELHWGENRRWAPWVIYLEWMQE